MKNKKSAESKEEKPLRDKQPEFKESPLTKEARAEEARQEMRQYKCLRMDHSG